MKEEMAMMIVDSWKLYDNPFYNSGLKSFQQHFHDHPNIGTASCLDSLIFTNPTIDSVKDKLDMARTQILELRTELEYERKERAKVETTNKRLAKELAQEKREREGLKRVCEELANEVNRSKAESNRIRREVEEEKRMLRMAEVFREERVQMKLAEARMLLEEKLLELEGTKQIENDNYVNIDYSKVAEKEDQEIEGLETNLFGKLSRLNLGDRSYNFDDLNADGSLKLGLPDKPLVSDNNKHNVLSSSSSKRKALPDPENPHIARGIKGFVEFPRVIQAAGVRNRHWGMKLDQCQKSQLRILLKQKYCPIRSNINLVLS